MAVTERKRITKGPNKGDLIIAKAASAAQMKAGNWWPVQVLENKGGDSTLSDNSGVRVGKKKKKKLTAKQKVAKNKRHFSKHK